MASKTIKTRQKIKNDTSTNWNTNNPILLAGEIGFETDTRKIKIGDGSSNWKILKYVYLSETEINTLILNNTSYTNATPTVTTLGGINAGTTFDDMSLDALLTKLLYPYTKPTISLQIGLNGNAVASSTSIREIGDPITSVTFKSTVTKKSDNIVSLKTYSGSTLAGTPTIQSSGGTISNTYTPTTNINSTTTFKSVVNDGTSDVTSNQITTTFVRPMYIGNVASNITSTNIDSSDILGTSMTKIITTKSNQIKTSSFTSGRFLFAYPTTYGNLKSILDPNNFEYIEDFTKCTVVIRCLDGIEVSYYAYLYNNVCDADEFTITYKF